MSSPSLIVARAAAALVVCAPACLAPNTLAQWSTDPLTNTPVGVQAIQQVQPKVAPTPDGGAYVSWYGGSGYDMWIQRLDAAGNPVWASPLQVADLSFSSTQDYGLSTDTANHALLAFRDDRFGGVQITAARIAPGGTLDWGTNGVQVTTDAASHNSPRIAGTADGGIVVGWSHDSNTRVTKLNSAGAVMWGPNIISDSPGTASFSVCDLKATDAPTAAPGSVIVLTVRQAGSTRILHARVYNAAGGDGWNFGPLFTTSSLQFGNFPTCISDGSGGMVTAWYTSSPLQCYVQRITSAGVAAYAAGGLAVSTNATRLRTDPRVAFHAPTSESYVFWRETNTLQSQSGVWGQRVDSAGNRLWGTDGVMLVPIGANDISQVRAAVMPNAQGIATAFWVEQLAFNNQKVHAQRLKADGTPSWTPAITDAAASASGKSNLAVGVSANHFAILAWQDNRSDEGDIYAQNVNVNGSLGPPPAVFGDLDGNGRVNGIDLALLLGAWTGGVSYSPCPRFAPSDLNQDCKINGLDLALLLGAWG